MSSSPKSPKEGGSTKELTIKYVNTAADNCPPQIKPYVQKAAPILGAVAEVIEKAIPIVQEYYEKAVILWKKLEPYKLELLIPSFIGLIMCFFGGSFLTIIAAVEAFRMCGYESTVNCVKMLISDLNKVYEANKKDDASDADGDGVKDVLQVSNRELIRRKTFLFLKVVDPKRITDAVAGINAGFLAVIATLKLQFAKTITLGNAIADSIHEPADRYVLPHLEKLLPPDYKKWAQPALTYAIKSTAISIAWTIQRVISAFHSAMRGGLMCSRNILHYLSEMKIIHIDHEETIIDEIIGYGLAVLGLFFQLFFGFGLPFPLNIILFPATLLERFLIWTVNSK